MGYLSDNIQLQIASRYSRYIERKHTIESSRSISRAPPTMFLLSLTPELLLEIVRHLDQDFDINSLVKTCRALWNTLSQELYVFDSRHQSSAAFFWGISKGLVITMKRSILASRGIPRAFSITGLDKTIANVVFRGHVSMASFWLGKGADANTIAKVYSIVGLYSGRRPPDRPLLHLAIDKGNAKMVKLLLRKGADPNGTYEGWPALSRATRKVDQKAKMAKMARLLLNAGADVHYTSPSGHTVLHNAAVWGNPRIIQLLLDHGADLNAKTELGKTALDRAFFCGNFEVIEYILDKQYSLMTDHNVTSHTELSHNEKLLYVLRDSGYDPSQQYGSVSNTILHHAADKNNVKWAELLLRLGADVDAHNTFGETPLHLAVPYRKVKAARMLVEHGASVNRLQKRGETPLHIAVRSRRLETIKLLIANGACPETMDNNSCTPLMVAIKVKYEQGKEFLSTDEASLSHVCSAVCY